MRKVLCISLLTITLTACGYFSKYPGYSKTWSGIYYKLLAIGDDKQDAQIGDYVTADITYKTLSDSIFFNGRRKFQITKPEYEGSVDECFTMLSKGDKAEFIISANNFFNKTLQTSLPTFIQAEADLKIEVNMLDIQTQLQYEKEKQAFLAWINDFGDFEKEILNQYINQQKINIQPTASGLYYFKIKAGNGHKVALGDTVVVDYEGRFLNGKFFDSTIKRKESFQFVYGTEWQVVKGLEEAIGLMQEGEKAMFILPSELAFGQEGSSTGIVPPFTSLIFEVELKKIN
jgi:FKBP-type peptidyl-prolyl cis-trans isomerase FkpA